MIEFVNVSKFYTTVKALEDVNLEIEEGEFAFLIGPSGCGKTSIIKLIIREEEPTSGKVYYYDTDVTTLKLPQVTQLRREVGVIFQDFKLLPHKNLFENVAFALEVAGKKKEDIEETVNYVLELVELADRAEAFPGEISGGETQKVAIARAIANNPKLLIADEPTGNLDPDSSWEIINLLSKINQWGTTVIMATHGSDIVDTLGKRVIQLEKGKVVADNKKGAYPKAPVPIDVPKKTKKQEAQAKPSKEIKPEKIKPKAAPQKPAKKDDIKEKEFEITFTTKQKVPTAKKAKKKKTRQGRDVVDLHKLKLPSKIEEALIKADITSIKKLRKTPKQKLRKIKGLGKIEIAKIQRALEKIK